jgi:hypothetical protein
MAEQERKPGNSRLVYDKTTRTIRPERTPADFSREFAGYMAKAAEDLMEAWIVNPGAYSGDERSDAFKALNSAVYEWRKREDRAQSTARRARSTNAR